MTRFLTPAQVLAIHDAIDPCPLLAGGTAKLEGAVGEPSQTWDGAWLHPTLLEQAAVLLVGLCNAHAFENANKRTAWMACVIFLDVNGVQLGDVAQSSVVKLMKDVARSRSNTADVTRWLNARC